MAWVCVNESKGEVIFEHKPIRAQGTAIGFGFWIDPDGKNVGVDIPRGTIQKLTGQIMTWKSEPSEVPNQEAKKRSRINWRILLLSLVWAFFVVVLSRLAGDTGFWSTTLVTVLTAVVFYFGYRDIEERD